MTFSSLKLLILVFCVILPERLHSTRRNFAVLTGGARRLLSSAGTALIVGWQVGNPILVHAYGPTDVEIKIKRLETAILLISNELAELKTKQLICQATSK